MSAYRRLAALSLMVDERDERVCQVQCLSSGPTYILTLEYRLELLIIDLRGLA
jgi:hypothetical protein